MNVSKLMSKQVPTCKICDLSHEFQYGANFCCSKSKRSDKPVVYISDIVKWRNR